MAEWIPPKTNWQAGDIPTAADFNRGEGNSEYLKTQTDGLKDGSIPAGEASKIGYATSDSIIYVMPVGNNIILASPNSIRAYSGGRSVTKKFRVCRPGTYRVTGQYGSQGTHTYDGVTVYVNDLRAAGPVGTGGSTRTFSQDITLLSTFTTITVTLSVADGTNLDGWLQNVCVRAGINDPSHCIVLSHGADN